MGWLLAIGYYFSITAVGLLVGLLYPSFVAFVLNKNVIDPEISELHSPIPLILASVISSAKCGLFTLLMLIALAFLASIIFSFWAIGVHFVT
jgi:hypothetical protein